MSNEFAQTYEEVYNRVKPINLAFDGVVMVIMTPTFFILIPLLMAAFRTKWSNMKIDMKIAVMIALLDLCSAIDAIHNDFFNLIHFPWSFSNQLACTLNAVITIFFFFNSICLIGLLSIERCLIVVHKKNYSDTFYYIAILAIMLTNSGICAYVAFNNGYGLVPIGVYCMFNINVTSGLIGSLLAGVLLFISLISIFYGYTKICLYRREQSKKAQIELGLDPIKVKKEVNSTVLKSLSIVFGSFLTYTPYTLILLLQMSSTSFQTPELCAVATIFIDINITINTLILINMKPELYKEIKKIYGFKVE